MGGDFAKKRRIKRGLRGSGLGLRLAWLGAPLAAAALSGCNFIDYGSLAPAVKAETAAAALGQKPWAVDGADDSVAAKLGAAQNPRILAAYGGEYHDVKLERMVAKIVGRLTAVSDNPRQTYRVVILDSPNINAFALPGGYVYVTRGLLALANDSAEVAAVIAHEMEHINAHHGLERRDKEQQLALSDRVANSVLTGQRRDEILVRGRLKLAGFSREQELAADRAGISMIAAAGYDPFASPRFLQAMGDYSHFRDISGAKDAGLDFLSNHPSTPQRVKLAIAAARRVSAPGVGETDRDSFLRGIDGMVFGDNISENGFFIRGQTFIDTQTGILFAVPRGFSLSCKGNVVMAAGPGDTALRFDSANLPAGQSAADYIASGWVSGLDKSTVGSFALNGFPAARARAQNAQWRFDVLVLADKKRVYRFLTAAPKSGADPEQLAQATAKTFRLLSGREKAAVKPLRVRIIAVRGGDTAANLAAVMNFDDKGQELFRIINGPAPSQTLRPGEKIKLIAP